MAKHVYPNAVLPGKRMSLKVVLVDAETDEPLIESEPRIVGPGETITFEWKNGPFPISAY